MTPAALAAARAQEAKVDQVRPLALRDRHGPETARCLDREGEGDRHRRDRYRNELARSHVRPIWSACRSRLAPNEACYIPIGHLGEGEGLFNEGLLPGQMPIREAIARLKPMLEDRSILKVGQNLKFDWLVLARHGIEIAPFDDTMLISYALDCRPRGSRHGRARQAAPQPYLHRLRGRRRQRQDARRLCARSDRQGDGIRGRRRRRDAAAMARAEAAADRRSA